MDMELKQQVQELEPGAHLCLFYEQDPAEQMPALVPFIQAGLARHEQCIYVADDQTIDQVAVALETDGVRVEEELERQALQLWTRSEWRQPGRLDSNKKLAQVQRMSDAARAAGFDGVRFAIEMTWTLGPDISVKRLMHWEATLNQLSGLAFPTRMICQYNRQRLTPLLLQAALRTHPLVVLGKRVYPSLFYEAPLITDGISEGEKLSWMIGQMERAREAEQAREAMIRQQIAFAESERARQQTQGMLERVQTEMLARAQAEEALQSLLHISQNLNSSLEIDQLLDHLVEGAMQLVNAESGCAGLHTAEGMVCHKYFQAGQILPLEYCWSPGHGLPGWLIQHKVPYLTNDALNDPQIVHELCVAFGVWSALSTPILDTQGEVLGFFEIHNKKDGTGFTQLDREKLMAVSQIAGIAIQNALAYRELQSAEKELRQQTDIVETVNRVGQLLNSQLDLQKIVQAVTDAGTELSGAQFGAFFYNVLDEHGESYMLYTLSGASQESFARFPLPRNTEIFAPTFRGEVVVRLDDVKQDPRYGTNAPYYGMPPGHLPVTSYLAVPVVSRTGQVLGGLFFGHSEVGVFTARAEQILVGLAAQAAIAMDNARLYQDAQDAIRIRERFLSIASHELRTPLTSIYGYTQLLLRWIEKNSEGANGSGTVTLDRERFVRNLKKLEKSGERLKRLIEELLDVSRLQSGRYPLTREWVDLSKLVSTTIDNVIQEQELGLYPTNVQFRFEPPTSGGIWGEWDATRLEQVIHNLLSNAVKYSPDGGIVTASLCTEKIPRAEADANASDSFFEHAHLIVRDQGIGIPQPQQDSLFEPFFRATNASKANFGGMGLGLAICKGIIEAHGGRIWVESAGTNRGSSFHVLLPDVQIQAASEPNLTM